MSLDPQPGSLWPKVGRNRLGTDRGNGLVEAHRKLALLAAKPAQRDRPLLGLALSNHQQQRDLGEAVLAHLVIDLLVAKVGLDADSSRCQRRRDLRGIFIRFDTIVATTAWTGASHNGNFPA